MRSTQTPTSDASESSYYYIKFNDLSQHSKKMTRTLKKTMFF